MKKTRLRWETRWLHSHVFRAKHDFETSCNYFQQRSISIGLDEGKVEKLDVSSAKRALGIVSLISRNADIKIAFDLRSCFLRESKHDEEKRIKGPLRNCWGRGFSTRLRSPNVISEIGARKNDARMCVAKYRIVLYRKLGWRVQLSSRPFTTQTSPSLKALRI